MEAALRCQPPPLRPLRNLYVVKGTAQLPLTNLHRPCLFATEIISPKGKIIKRYKHKDVKTPLECLALLCEKGLVTLKQGITLEALQAIAKSQTDLAAAQAMQLAKSELFARFVKPRRQASP